MVDPVTPPEVKPKFDPIDEELGDFYIEPGAKREDLPRVCNLDDGPCESCQ